MRAPVPAVLVAAALVAGLLAGCAGADGPSSPGIAARTPVVPEERSTCEALERADLAGIATDPAGLTRTARALDAAAARAPDAIGADIADLAVAYRRAAKAPSLAAALPDDPGAAAVVRWIGDRCGESR